MRVLCLCFCHQVQRIEEEIVTASAKKKQSEKAALDLEETVRSRDTEIAFLKNKLYDAEQSLNNLREKHKDLEQECIVVKSKYSKLEAHYENVHEQKVLHLQEPYNIIIVKYDNVTSSEASPTIWSCYANLNHYHYSFL